MSERELSHPAARAVHAVYAAVRLADGVVVHAATLAQADERCGEIIRVLENTTEDIAALYVDNEAKAAEMANLLGELCRMAQYVVRLEDANTRHVLTESDLKTRLARAAEENEELYRLTNHEVGDATTRHLAVTRIRALLDLDTPLPPRKSSAISTPTHYGAPRPAATH
jgi:hypothetical protein